MPDFRRKLVERAPGDGDSGEAELDVHAKTSSQVARLRAAVTLD
jgi:hypothetical protein